MNYNLLLSRQDKEMINKLGVKGWQDHNRKEYQNKRMDEIKKLHGGNLPKWWGGEDVGV